MRGVVHRLSCTFEEDLDQSDELSLNILSKPRVSQTEMISFTPGISNLIIDTE